MTFKMLQESDLMPASQQVMKALSLSEKYPEDGYLDHADALIKKHTAKELFQPDENLDAKKNRKGKNVLHYAIEVGDTTSALALIYKEGVTPEQLYHQESTTRYTPLHDAIAYGNEKVALDLVSKADKAKYFLRKNNEKKTALDMAQDKMPDVAKAIEKLIKELPLEIPHSTQALLPLRRHQLSQ